MNSDKNTSCCSGEELTPQLIQRLAETSFCETGISELADLFRDMPLETANQWVDQLTEMGEDVALTHLLEVFAYCGFVLDPAVLVRSGMVVSDISCISYAFSHQDERVIPHLLEMARSEELSFQRQILYARLAAEFILRYGADDDGVRRILHYLSELPVYPESRLMAIETLSMLDSEKLEPGVFPVLIDLDIKKELPARPPPKVIATGGTLRRPVAKVGRNDPCHCGSGKKYKRCCLSKDEKLLADASEYEGITKQQILENPGMISDTRFIDEMRAYEIKKLDPTKLNGHQLIVANHRAAGFGLLEIAFDMLVECSRRTDLDFEFDPGHFGDLLEKAFRSGNMDVAERARNLIPDDFDLVDWDDVNMQFEMYRTPGVLAALEKRCATALDSDAEFDFLRDYDLSNLSHIFSRKFPALSILFARAAVSQCPDRTLDNEMLVDVVHECRVDLGLEPWDDPIDEMVSEGERESEKHRHELKHVSIESNLRGELAVARDQAKSAAENLRDAEADLQKMKKELAATEKSKDDSDKKSMVAPVGPLSEQRETMERLRRQIENMKVEIGNQQEQRRKLREQLEREQHSGRNQEIVSEDNKTDVIDEQVEMPSKKERRILIPEYKEAFRNACGNMPASLAGGAIKAIGGIASYDTAAWRNFRSLKRLPNIYRMRIGIHYRLLLKWIPGKELSVLDLIPRQDLESWIKRHDV